MLLISIVMPVYNTSQYLKACLDSILQQTEKEWELLAVDDYSTDQSLSILKNYAIQDPRIKVFKNNSKGIIGALKKGFNHSRGKLITRMDSDDIMNPNKLAVLKSSLIMNGKGHLAVGPVKYFSENGIGEGFKKYETWLNQLTSKGNNFDDIYKECVIPSPSWMCHLEDFLACGGFSHHTYPEDYDLSFRFFSSGLKCIPCNKTLHHWRDYQSRTSRTHPHYADNTFLQIKLDYFLQLSHHKTKKILVWGAGKKGKKTAKLLLHKSIDFDWVCDNPKKIGHVVYGKKLLDFNSFHHISSAQSIITVANADAQAQITAQLNHLGQIRNRDYFFFC